MVKGPCKDTVFEFRYDNNTGNGFTFESHNAYELIQAISRSLGLFQNKEKYEICRKNAKNSAIDVADVSRAWCKEFCRLKNKIFFNLKEAKNIDDNQIFELKGQNNDNIKEKEEKVDDGLIPFTFSYKFEKGKKLNNVFLCGSFTNWKEKIPLIFDPLTEKWSTIVRLPKGKHFYKYIVNNDWIINPSEPNERGRDGIVNNVVEFK